MSRLDSIWTEFCKEFSISETVSNKWLKYFQDVYSPRLCNDLSQLNEKLRCFDSCRSNLNSPWSVLLALIFQLVSYDPKATDNHIKSIEEFDRFSSESGLAKDHEEVVANAKQLIELSSTNSTEEHLLEGAIGHDDSHYFVDLNFIAYGTPNSHEYDEFCSKARQEYNFLDDSSYKNLRLKVLQNFLLIPNIYATEEFRKQYEAKARDNIQNEINSLLANDC